VGGLKWMETEGTKATEQRAGGLTVDGGTHAGSSSPSSTGPPSTPITPAPPVPPAPPGTPAPPVTQAPTPTSSTTVSPTTTTPASGGGPVAVSATSSRWNWWNGGTQNQGSWVAKVTLQNAESLGGNVDVRIVKVYADGTSSSEHTQWVGANGTSTFDIWNLDYAKNGSAKNNVVAVTVQPLRIRLTDGTTRTLDVPPQRIEMPPLP